LISATQQGWPRRVRAAKERQLNQSLAMGTSFSTMIDLRSFSNVWYWIALALMWSSASHWVLGIPSDLVARAQRHGGQSMADLEAMARINVARLLSGGRTRGLWIVGGICFVLAGLFSFGFLYGVEFAQATFLLVFPLSLIWLMSLNTAMIIQREGLAGEDLCRQIVRHRFFIQTLGVMFLLLTAMWGVYQNLLLRL